MEIWKFIFALTWVKSVNMLLDIQRLDESALLLEHYTDMRLTMVCAHDILNLKLTSYHPALLTKPFSRNQHYGLVDFKAKKQKLLI